MTDVRTSQTGQNVSSLALVSADQVTILGDGSAENPLRAVAADESSGDFISDFSSTAPILGNAMRFVSGSIVRAIANGTLAQAAVVGLVAEFLGGSSVRCRSRGLLELTTAEWDLVTDQSGGLTPGEVYHLSLSFGATAGKLSAGNAGSGSDNIAQVGVAINSTTMLVGLPATPLEGSI